jgi:hypothetical protein
MAKKSKASPPFLRQRRVPKGGWSLFSIETTWLEPASGLKTGVSL